MLLTDGELIIVEKVVERNRVNETWRERGKNRVRERALGER